MPASSGSPVIVIEHAAEAASASDCSVACRESGIRENEQVADALMIAFGVIMGREFPNRCPQGVFSRKNHSFQTLAAFSRAQREGEGTVAVAGKADEPLGKFRNLVRCRGGFLAGFGMFCRPQLGFGDEAAKILIARAILDEQCVIAAVGAADFRARVTCEAMFFHAREESRRAVDAVAIEERHGGDA